MKEGKEVDLTLNIFKFNNYTIVFSKNTIIMQVEK